jgi:glycosyltransferase involved in cell wall biosynthesis
VAVRNARGLTSNVLLTRADRLIALSDFAADTFRQFGLPGARLVTVPNGVSGGVVSEQPPPGRPRWLAVGRLRAEKGFAELLRGWPGGHRLDIVGDGPQRAELGGWPVPMCSCAAPCRHTSCGTKCRAIRG